MTRLVMQEALADEWDVPLTAVSQGMVAYVDDPRFGCHESVANTEFSAGLRSDHAVVPGELWWHVSAAALEYIRAAALEHAAAERVADVLQRP